MNEQCLWNGTPAPVASLPTVSGAFDSLLRVLFIFPSRYLFAIGLSLVFSFGWDLPPTLGCIPKQPDSKARTMSVPQLIACNCPLLPSLMLPPKTVAKDSHTQVNEPRNGKKLIAWSKVRGYHPLWHPFPGDLWPRPFARRRSTWQGYNSKCHTYIPTSLLPKRLVAHLDFKPELLPLRSPLLRGSLLVSSPPLNDMLKSGG